MVWRAGLDLNPLDVTDPADLAWLEALIWPEHAHRRARLRAAAALAAAEPPLLVRGDLVDDLPALAAQAPAGATLVVFHTSVLYQVPAPRREAFISGGTRAAGALDRDRGPGRADLPDAARTAGRSPAERARAGRDAARLDLVARAGDQLVRVARNDEVRRCPGAGAGPVPAAGNAGQATLAAAVTAHQSDARATSRASGSRLPARR